MNDESDEPQGATQKTPKGAEIPVPTREEVMRDLRRVAQPVQPQPAPDAQKGD